MYKLGWKCIADVVMAFGPLENFRNFLSSRPPLVLFVVCIGMIAIAFISYAYYIKYNDVYNPDVQEKLEKFAKNVTGLNLCTKLSNQSWVLAHNAKPANVTLEDVFFHYNLNNSRKISAYNTISFPVTVSVSFLKKKGLLPNPITDFISAFPVSVLGVSGENENMSLAMEMVPKEPVSLKCLTEVCLVEYEMCATVIAPEGILPNTRQPYLNECMFPKDNSSNAFLAWLDVSAPSSRADDHSLAECKSSILLKAEPIKEQLTVLLTLEKRSEVNMHLMHSSYFLFVVVLTILLFGILTGGGERKHARNQGNHYSMMGSIAP